MRRLLVLRPEPGASATVERARALGLEATAAPLFEVEPVEWRAPNSEDFDGLLLTSANALRHGGDELSKVRGLPVYTVGETTAEAAREAGFNVATAGSGGVDEVLNSIPADLRLLHLCGEDRREPVDGSITAITVYRAKEIEQPGLNFARGAVALIHSPRAGRRFAELVDGRADIAIAAISPTAAEAVGVGWETVAAADRPSDEALLALASRLCNKPTPQ